MFKRTTLFSLILVSLINFVSADTGECFSSGLRMEFFNNNFWFGGIFTLIFTILLIISLVLLIIWLIKKINIMEEKNEK